MKKNKRSRIFSRVLSRLAWATFYHVNDENGYTYNEVLAAKRLIEDFGGEDVKPLFYNREWHIQFTLPRCRECLNRYYTVSASHGYENDYNITNRDEMRNLIGRLEFECECALRRDFHAYQMFNEVAESVLYAVLTPGEFSDYCHNGEVSDIPYDVAIRLWRELHSCSMKISNEAVAYRKVVL